jgi:integrase
LQQQSTIAHTPPPAPLHTANHLNCPGCRAMSMVRSEVHLADMLFGDAFERWINARVLDPSAHVAVKYLAARSIETYREYGDALSMFFAGLRLREVHDGHLRQYQIDRASGSGSCKTSAGQNRIHKEIGLLLRMLRAAGVWSEDLSGAFQQLPHVDTDVPRSMEPDEQKRLLSVLAKTKRWSWIRDYAVVALQTCAATNEIRSIRLRDINFRNQTVRIGPEGSKNKYRNRTIPLETPEVLKAFSGLYERALKMGCESEDHYLLPFGGGSRRDGVDPTQPISRFGLNGQWGDIRKEAGVPWLRPYDLRHTAITRMAEAGTPIAVIMAFAGHISPKMQQHYTTISMQAKRAAAAVAWRVPELGAPPKKPSMGVGQPADSRMVTLQ